MIRRSELLLVIACFVLGLAALNVHGLPAFDHAGWAGACRQQVSAGFVIHMAELQVRRLLAVAGEVASFR